ncbi:MAG TPA: efflux RND transporter periplasmic adaptor subunit [bacterium]
MTGRRLPTWGRIALIAAVAAAAAWGIARLRPERPYEILRSVKVSRGPLIVTTTATGEVKPQNRVEVKPPIAGRIESVLVREGEAVAKGQVLAWLSSTERAALLDAARSQGEDALERWQAAYKAAPLIAPLEGSVIVRAVEPGQTVGTADPVVVLADRLIVEALVDETDLSLIELGQEARIRLDAYPSSEIPAVVDHIAYESRLINNVNVYPVDVLPMETPSTFRSGMTAGVTFMIANREEALLVPSEAIAAWPQELPRPPRAGLAVYRRRFGGGVEPAPVEIGATDGKMTEVLEGLKAGEEVLVVRRRERAMGINPFSRRGGSRSRSR